MMIFMIIAGGLLFLLFVPIPLMVSYRGEVEVRTGIIYPFFKVFSTDTPKGQKKEKKQKEKKPIDKHMLWDLVKKIPGHIRYLLTVTKMQIYVTVGHEDPADLALLYGGTNAVLDVLGAALSSIYPREKWDVSVMADFDSAQTSVVGVARAYTNLCRVIYVLISFVFSGILLSSKTEGAENDG